MGNPFKCLAFYTEQVHPYLPATCKKAFLWMLLPDGKLVLRYKIEKHSQQVGAGVKVGYEAEAVGGHLAEQSVQFVGLGVIEAHHSDSKAAQRPHSFAGHLAVIMAGVR